MTTARSCSSPWVNADPEDPVAARRALTAAERQRRHRERRREGIVVLRVSVPQLDTIDALVMAGELAEEDVDNADKITDALARVLDRWVTRTLRNV